MVNDVFIYVQIKNNHSNENVIFKYVHEQIIKNSGLAFRDEGQMPLSNAFNELSKFQRSSFQFTFKGIAPSWVRVLGFIKF